MGDGGESSGQSLSHRSTEVANERSGASSNCDEGGVMSLDELGVEGVCAWLETADLGAYVEAFRANKIDGEMLMEVSALDPRPPIPKN